MPSDVSLVPAYGLVGLLVAAVLLLGIAVWFGVRSRGYGGARIGQAVLMGLAVWCLGMLVAGVQHYGGTVHGAGDTCDVWYREAGLPASQKALAGDLSAACRHDAIAAIVPAVGWSALAGVCVGGLFAFGGWAWQRRPRRVRTTRYVDVDG